jgi:hypothetical protein
MKPLPAEFYILIKRIAVFEGFYLIDGITIFL